MYPLVLKGELQLDSLKQKGAVKRTLFFDYHQSHHYFSIVIERQKQLHCQDFLVYLRVSCLKYFGLSLLFKWYEGFKDNNKKESLEE